MPNLTDDMLEAEIDIKIADWGKTFTYTRVSVSDNVQTGVITETLTTSTESGIGGRLSKKDLPYSNGRGTVGDRTVLVKVEDMPEWPPKTTSRFTWNSIEYQIVGHTERQSGVVGRLIGRDGSGS